MLPFHQAAARAFAYLFASNPAINSQDYARTSGFLQFQGYPDNAVQGAGTLVGRPGATGNYWRSVQPQLAYQSAVPILTSLTGGGVPTGSLLMMPLANTTNSMG